MRSQLKIYAFYKKKLKLHDFDSIIIIPIILYIVTYKRPHTLKFCTLTQIYIEQNKIPFCLVNKSNCDQN